jgi:hypothetical protein
MGSSFSMDGGGMSPEEFCAICTEAGPDEDTGLEQVLICPNGHYAHVDCVSLWYAQADKCPECRVDVTEFPLWKEINPPVVQEQEQEQEQEQDLQAVSSMEVHESEQPSYNFNDPVQLMIVLDNFRTIQNQNDYNTAFEYFTNAEGYAYVNYMIDEDMRHYEYKINVQEEDPESVDMTSLMFRLVGLGYMNVAEALYDYAQRNDLLEDLHYSSGPILNKFVDDYEENIHNLNWLHSRGFRAGFGFLEKAALETKNINAVNWYLRYIVSSRNDEKLIELFNNMDEQDAVYAVLDRYFNMNIQVQQSGGGMWQRGGFFMTCS